MKSTFDPKYTNTNPLNVMKKLSATLRKHAHSALVLAAVASFSEVSAQTQADLITFEPDASGYLPDGTLAVDNLSIGNQFQGSYGVSFGTDTNNDLVIDAGSGLTLENTSNTNGGRGFYANVPAADNTADAGYETQLGDWFLRKGGSDSRILITYDNPVTAASAEIWDIDGWSSNFEQWEVSAYDANKNLLGTIESPVGVNYSESGSLDAKPWLWSFDFGNAGEEISTVLMEYTGNTMAGLAFNNFATSSSTNDLLNPGTPVGGVTTPEPAFSAMLGIFVTVAYMLRKRSQKQ